MATIAAWLRAGWPLIAVPALAAVFLLPALRAGYWGEDVYYSILVPGTLIHTGDSLAHFTWEGVRHTLDLGRFYPLTPVITAVVFTLFQDVVAYKAYIIAMTVLDVAAFGLLVRKLTGDARFAGLAALIAVALFQFRVFVDPFLGYYGQIQWVVFGLFASLLMLQEGLDRRRWTWIYAGALAYFGCTLTYEVAYTLVPLHLLLIVRARREWRSRLSVAWPFLVAVGACAAMTFVFRRLHPSESYIHQTNRDLGRVLMAMAHQTTAALPLSYFLADPLGLFSEAKGLRWWLAPGSALIAAAGLVLADRLIRRPEDAPADGEIGRGWLVAMGLILVILPATPTAFSPYHQGYIHFGVGWIGVMIQFYGVALLGAVGLRWAVRGPRTGLVAAVAIGGLLGVTHRANVDVAAKFNAPAGTADYREFAAMHGAATHRQRLNHEAAIGSGLLDEVPDRAYIQMANLYPYWQDETFGRFFYATRTGKRIETIPSSPPPTIPNLPSFRVRDVFLDEGRGLVVLSEGIQGGDGLRLFVHHFRLFREGAVPRVCLVAGPDDRPTRLRPGRDLDAIRSGRDWALYSLKPSAGRIDPETIRMVDDPIAIARLLRSEAPAPIATGGGGVER